MLLNLKAEFVRKGLDPVSSISSVLCCTDKTARNKIDGRTDFTVPEAIKIVDKYFKSDGYGFEYLFNNANANKPAWLKGGDNHG